MAQITDRDLHLVKKALCLSIAVIERPDSDAADMKDLADRLMANDAELAHYLRSARIILAGKPE
jgi:hypothetical protein